MRAQTAANGSRVGQSLNKNIGPVIVPGSPPQRPANPASGQTRPIYSQGPGVEPFSQPVEKMADPIPELQPVLSTSEMKST
eukprot:gene168-917_t